MWRKNGRPKKGHKFRVIVLRINGQNPRWELAEEERDELLFAEDTDRALMARVLGDTAHQLAKKLVGGVATRPEEGGR